MRQESVKHKNFIGCRRLFYCLGTTYKDACRVGVLVVEEVGWLPTFRLVKYALGQVLLKRNQKKGNSFLITSER
jgi:hypothetical protein